MSERGGSNRARKLEPPLLTEGELSGQVFVVTVGKIMGDNPKGQAMVEATTKYDVTDQFEALAERRGWKRPSAGPVERGGL